MKRIALAILLALASLTCASAQVLTQSQIYLGVNATSGNVAAATATATLPATAGKVTFICGFAATGGGATAASVVNLTITNVVPGTLTFTYGAALGAAVPNQPLFVNFFPCVSATASNTTIVVSMPSLGAGNTNAAINAWGFQR